MFGKICKPLTPAARKARTLRRTAGSTFYVAALATTAANVWASQHTPIGVAVGLWAPVAFFLSLELMERMPVKGWQGKLRSVAIGFLALVAAWTSYWHLLHVLREAGVTDPVTLYLLPLTVDVMMALARASMNHKAAAAPSRPAARRPAAKAATVRKLKVV